MPNGSAMTEVSSALARARAVRIFVNVIRDLEQVSLTFLLGEKDAVFVLEDGATLRNVVIGANQKEGVHCLGACNLEFVWFEDVCEDAITIKGSGTANIIGGGAYKGSDKLIQHNGCGHVNIVNFCKFPVQGTMAGNSG